MILWPFFYQLGEHKFLNNTDNNRQLNHYSIIIADKKNKK